MIKLTGKLKCLEMNLPYCHILGLIPYGLGLNLGLHAEDAMTDCLSCGLAV